MNERDGKSSSLKKEKNNQFPPIINNGEAQNLRSIKQGDKQPSSKIMEISEDHHQILVARI